MINRLTFANVIKILLENKKKTFPQYRMVYCIFSKCMNMTPVEYINWVRIKTACDELKRTNDSIGDIAVRAGFSTLSTFNRNFQKVMGISPREWRAKPEHYERKLLKYDIKTQEGW